MTEKFYDEEIAPRLREVGKLCVENGIPFLAVVEYATSKIGKTAFQTNDECIEMVMIRHCANTAPNIDNYFIGLSRWAHKNKIDMSASIILKHFNSQQPAEPDVKPICGEYGVGCICCGIDKEYPMP